MYNTDTYTGPSFSFRNRMARFLWNATSGIFFRLSPRPFHSWRAFLLRCFGAKVGRGAHIYPKVNVWAPWNIVFGDQCGIANGVTLYSQGKITIGRKAIISQGAHLCGGTHDYTDPGHPLIAMPIKIADQVWVAAEAFIHPGVTIGEGAVIGARSVVTKDMPAWMICVGNPCRPIKQRIITKK